MSVCVRQFPMRVFARLLLVGKGVISNGVTISVLGILDDPCHARVARWQLPRIQPRLLLTDRTDSLRRPTSHSACAIASSTPPATVHHVIVVGDQLRDHTGIAELIDKHESFRGAGPKPATDNSPCRAGHGGRPAPDSMRMLPQIQ